MARWLSSGSAKLEARASQDQVAFGAAPAVESSKPKLWQFRLQVKSSSNRSFLSDNCESSACVGDANTGDRKLSKGAEHSRRDETTAAHDANSELDQNPVPGTRRYPCQARRAAAGRSGASLSGHARLPDCQDHSNNPSGTNCMICFGHVKNPARPPDTPPRNEGRFICGRR